MNLPAAYESIVQTGRTLWAQASERTRQSLIPWFGTVVVALVAILFAQATVYSSSVFAGWQSERPILAFWVTPLAFAGLVWLTKHVFRGTEGSGIPQAIAAISEPEISRRTPVLSLRIAIGKLLLTTAAIGAGASAGREGPTVQVGAAVMHTFSHTAMTRTAHRTFLIAGGAAGLSAAFNTPLAGVVFAIEELARFYEERNHGRTIMAVVIAGVVSFSMLGNYAYFGHASASLRADEAWLPVLVCGALGGLLGGGFSRVLLAADRFARRPRSLIRRHPVAFAATCGFGLSLLGLASHETVLGTGYPEARMLLEQSDELSPSFGLFKQAATLLSYVSGIPGGLFSPSLAVGAGLGDNVAAFLPGVPAAAVVMLGMVGYFTGVVQVPLTASVIVMEMTSDPSLTLPLLVTAFLAHAVSQRVCPRPLYRTLAARALADAGLDPHKVGETEVD